MKKMMIALMAVLITVALAGIGTYAYFSDTETSQTNIITAGTLNMQIADSDEGWNDNNTPVTTSWKSPTGFKPGDTFTTDKIRLKNVGTIEIPYLTTTYHNEGNSGVDLASVIEVVEYQELVPGKAWKNNIGNTQKLETMVGDLAAPLTLKELTEAYWVGDTTWQDYTSGMAYDTEPGPAIIVGGTYETYLVLHFMETAGDIYQGASCWFDIQFDGKQDLSQKSVDK